MARTLSALGVTAVGAFALIAVLPDESGQEVLQVPTSAHRATRSSVQLVEPAQIPDPAAETSFVRSGAFSITRSADSHFYADADVNGAKVRFLIDTGASAVVLSAEDAQRAGIQGDNYSEMGQGAGGKIPLMPARVDRLALGTIVARDLPVKVAKSGLPVSLLGQSYLAGIGTVTISGDVMTFN